MIKILKSFDYFLCLCVLVLVTIGILFIYSSGINSEGINVSREYVKQIIWASIGVVLMILMTAYDYRHFSRYVQYMYGFLCLVLIYTRIFGRYVNGARSWIGFGGFGIQPSEFCKIIFILFLAWYLERSENENSKNRFIKSLLILAFPLGLILLQPDLGTASVYIPIFIIMCFVADIPIRYIFLIIAGGGLSVVFAVLPIWQSEIAHTSIPVINILTNTKLCLIVISASAVISAIGAVGTIFYRGNKTFYWIAYVFGVFCVSLVLSRMFRIVLKDYQIQRLIVFIDPSSDPLGAGWNIIQSKIAIGSGNVFGQGYLRGTQSHYRFLPQQSTDFIFSILAEEFGFVGGIIVFAIYFLILIRTIYIIRETSNTFGFYIASGILGMFAFHFIVNVGMVMGIMPITGIPLLFLSYGGSSLWTAMMCIGLLMSINCHKFEF